MTWRRSLRCFAGDSGLRGMHRTNVRSVLLGLLDLAERAGEDGVITYNVEEESAAQ